VSVAELKKRPKYSVINFCSSLELFLKARLLKEHWSLIVSRPEHANINIFLAGDFKSVTMAEAVKRLNNIAHQTLTKQEKDCFIEIKEQRNKLVHFFDKKYSDKRYKKTIDTIIVEQCKGWFYLHGLLTNKWRDEFSHYASEIKKLDKLMHQHREFLREKFKSLKPQIQALISAGGTIATCFACGFSAAHQIEDTPPIKDCKCLVCGSTDRYLYIPCPYCEKDQVYAGSEYIECTGCGKRITVDNIIEHFEPIPHDPDEDLLAYCHCCINFKPSVVELSNKWICLVCLELHDEPGHCGWCNEYVTGDLEGSVYYGCSQCEGRRGWDDDD
jgi:hypothetical protein